MCIYVGDVGDGPNPPHRDEIILYKVREPTVHAYQKMTVITTLGWTRYHYKYPDYARDCESILIDAEHREFIVVSKSENHGKVFKAPLDVPEHTYDNKLTYTGIYLNGLNRATDASSSADGKVHNFTQDFKNISNLLLFLGYNCPNVQQSFHVVQEW